MSIAPKGDCILVGGYVKSFHDVSVITTSEEIFYGKKDYCGSQVATSRR